MRRVLIVVSVLLFLTTAVSTASAQGVIDLAGSSSSVGFVGSGGGNWTLNWGTISGTGEGFGVFASGPAPYSITEVANTTITGTLTSSSPTKASWSITQNKPLTFSYGAGGSLLKGSLELVNLTVTGKTGNFDTTLVVDLTGLSGSLAHFFSPVGGIVQLTLQFGIPALDLVSLGKGYQVRAYLSGEVIQTPEPVSMLLVGSGLLTLGALVRRRRKA